MTGVYTELENVYAGKSASPLRGGSPAEPEVGGQTEAYGRCLSPLTLPPLTGTHIRCTRSQTRCRSSEKGRGLSPEAMLVSAHPVGGLGPLFSSRLLRRGRKI